MTDTTQLSELRKTILEAIYNQLSACKAGEKDFKLEILGLALAHYKRSDPDPLSQQEWDALLTGVRHQVQQEIRSGKVWTPKPIR